ncbi:Helix-turn-helix domain-containing protein [Pseudarcicella hirudinis]|uniref:Helix-turn-helix domain-containing protein n=1 Tax=Pseudarcicella hirudinis TaxID=1079859 RepID=A0A1I5YD02_9BACT|nr:helix-turn-helix transcriptional regulator [Pseudarcicella hirudinis]SFQ42076.1 Helix-turn-helix domain-containing protein [Pseudarcicella hirudinis]
MKYYTIQPSSELSGYVRYFWVLECDISRDQPYIHRSMADGCAELIFHYQGRFDELLINGTSEKSFISGIHGQAQKHSRFTINESFGIFGVYLYPYALPKLFSIPAEEFSNQMVDIASLLGQKGKDLEEQIMLAGDNSQRVKILSAFLKNQQNLSSKSSPEIFSSIDYIIQTKGLINVEALADQYTCSVRQFERKFKEYSGFSPKLYSRIIRFQAALSEYGNTGQSLTEIAYACGYYDQSHFIHDFKEFSGHHPRHYFLKNGEGTEWRN